MKGEEPAVKVHDAMTENVLTLTPGRTLREAAEFMCKNNVGAAVILDPEQPGPGIVTERDVVRALGRGHDPDSEQVKDHLTATAVFADSDWDLEEAADRMAEGGFRHLVVRPRGRRDRDHLDARPHPRVAACRRPRASLSASRAAASRNDASESTARNS